MVRRGNGRKNVLEVGQESVMGVTLSEPVTEKETEFVESKYFRAGASSMQGWRVNMEDAHTMRLGADADDPESAFFAVFDGHGGSVIARHVSDALFRGADYVEALRSTFMRIDSNMAKSELYKNEPSGTTALAVFIKNDKVYCSNVGDSRCVASVQGEVQELSHDHKPTNREEEQRIYAAGGFVDYNRVNGNLALSRALGDFSYKKNPDRGPDEQIVIALPDVTVHDISADHEFVVLACDGIWDVLSNQEVVDFVRTRLACGIGPDDICEQLMMRCLAPDTQMGGIGCDNMTVIIVCLTGSQGWDEFQQRCRRTSRVPPGGYELYSKIGQASDCPLF